MPKIYIPSKVRDKILRLAQSGSFEIRSEVSKVAGALKFFKKQMTLGGLDLTEYDNGDMLARSPIIEKQFWRLRPLHIHCIGLLEEKESAVHEVDVHVLAACNRSTIVTVEKKLSKDP